MGESFYFVIDRFKSFIAIYHSEIYDFIVIGGGNIGNLLKAFVILIFTGIKEISFNLVLKFFKFDIDTAVAVEFIDK